MRKLSWFVFHWRRKDYFHIIIYLFFKWVFEINTYINTYYLLHGDYWVVVTMGTEKDPKRLFDWKTNTYYFNFQVILQLFANLDTLTDLLTTSLLLNCEYEHWHTRTTDRKLLLKITTLHYKFRVKKT